MVRHEKNKGSMVLQKTNDQLRHFKKDMTKCLECSQGVNKMKTGNETL